MKRKVHIKILIISFILAIVFSFSASKADEEYNSNIQVNYQTHVQNVGWQGWKKNGEVSGTSGLSYRLEGIKIDLSNLSENISIKYQVHIQDYGWQNWKSDGEFAGTEGQSKRLEGIKIKLDNTEKYSVKYRVHVQDYGWQDWRYDGEFAGTEGQSKRLEAIEIKIESRVDRGIIKIEEPSNNQEINYKNRVRIAGWCMSSTAEDILKVKVDGVEIPNYIARWYRADVIKSIDGYGGYAKNPNPAYDTFLDLSNYSDGQHKVTMELYTGSGKWLSIAEVNINLDTSMKVNYQTHVQNIGWQAWKKNGQMSGTSGLSYRLEGIKINLSNSTENIKIKYQVHIQDYGWQNWKYDGEFAGTEGQAKRLEGIKIQLENTEKYSIKYRVHVQDYGWQDWRYDGEFAGTEGQSKRLEAIEIRIEPKTDRGIIKIEEPTNYREINSKTIRVAGWSMSNVTNDILKVRVDGVEISNYIARWYREDVIKNTDGYGGNAKNPNPAYDTFLDLSNYPDGHHKISMELYTESGKWLSTAEVIINLDTEMKILYQAHIQNIGWQDWKRNGEWAGTTGQSLRIEAIRIKLLNCPDNVKIQYNVHIQNLDWQGWKNDGETAGTEGKGLRIEAIKIRLIDKYSGNEIDNLTVLYSAHVQNIGWQREKVDGEVAGTTGDAFRIEALNMYILKWKLPRGKIKLELPQRSVYTGDTVSIRGWEMSTTPNSIVEVYIDNTKINTQINREIRNDINNSITDYGSYSVNPTPGFETTLDINNYSEGNHTLKIKLYSSDRTRLLDEIDKSITISKNQYFGVDVSKWQENINWDNVKHDGVNYAILRIGYGQTLTNKDVFFEANYNSCVNNKIPIGIYTYSYAENVEEAKLEAQAVLTWLNGRSLSLPIFWDTESECQRGIDRNTLTQMADVFCSIIESNTDSNGKYYKAGIYGSKNWLTEKLNMEYLQSKYDVWVAQYNSQCNYTGRYEIWQNSDSGNISGINGKVDTNWFYKKY